ncbi:MAG TPA: ABC transporter substrate-binding protein [Patescibacteria group bacterium]|nr:ABC transporter substrate-binding protein [Gammaproteobacteria bacterium]HWA51449.1 ABC transporter substrate-binding protein [Patescibacteria group bacterium]
MSALIFRYFIIIFLLFSAVDTLATPASNPINDWKQYKNFLIFAVPVSFGKFDPISFLQAHTKYTLPLVFEPLVSINPNQELEPILAKSWDIDQQHNTITITLNNNHKFSDGSQVTSQDVVNSILRVCSNKSRVSLELEGLIGCNKQNPQVEALNATTIKFKINTHPTIFLFQLASPNAVITKRNLSGELLGSGPYFLDTLNHDYIILKKNTHYYDPLNIKNDGIIFYYLDKNKVHESLKTERPDGIIMYRTSDLNGLQDDNYKTIKSNSNITMIFVINNFHFPFNYKIVREAISAEIYDQHKVEFCVSNSHKAYGIIPTGLGGSIANMSPISKPKINPETVFKQVPSLKDKMAIVYVHRHIDSKNTCEENALIEAAKKYNISMKFIYDADYSILLSLYQNHKADAFMELYVAKNREAYTVLQPFAHNGANVANIKGFQLDNLLNIALSEPSSHKRFQDYNAIAKYIESEAFVIPLYYSDHSNLISQCILGVSKDFYFNPYRIFPSLYKSRGCVN